MKIISAVVNNPVFIQIQYYTLQKYFKGEYEFIIFNDAKAFPDFTNYNDNTIKDQIEEMCKKLDIKCIPIPNDHHKTKTDPSARTADSMNYILQYQIANPDKYLLLDSDMFLIDYFDISKYNNYDCAVILQTRKHTKYIKYIKNITINYIWNGIYYFNIHKLKNITLLNWNTCYLCDTGGMTQYWLTDQMKTNNNYFIKNLQSLTWDKTNLPNNLHDRISLINFLENDPRNINNKYFCEIYDNVFLHYRAGGNWQNTIKYTDLIDNLKNILLNII